MRTAPLVARLVASFGALAVLVSADVPRGVDFAKLADQYFEAHPVQGKEGAPVTLEDLMEAHYCRAEVGAIDLRFPREFLEDKGKFDDFKACASTVLRVHEEWLDWVGAPAEAAAAAKADIAELQKFLKNAKLSPGGQKEKDFFAGLNGSNGVKPALERLRDGFRNGKSLGLQPRGGTIQSLLVAPTRQNFVELAGVLGKLQEASRSLYWNDGLLAWTEFGWNEVQVVATQYPPIHIKTDDFSEGVAMDSREATGLSQHIAQRTGVTLCWHCFGGALDPAFELAIGQTIVVDLYGENNTRSGGSGRSNTTDGITAFIPGGNSAGGALPPTNAESSWRTTLGKDYFAKPLREAQKAGSKNGKSKEEKLAYFQLLNDTGAKRFPIRAPFFGSAAQGKELPPTEFMSDYLEFFRAYKSCFLHWLREESEAKSADSHAKLAKLLQKVAEAGGAAPFQDLVAEAYGVPYSDVDLGKDTLETRFLHWLPTSK